MDQRDLRNQALSVSGQKARRWVGIDPGQTQIGVAIVDYDGADSFKSVYHGTLPVTKGLPLALALDEVYDRFQDVLDKYQPEALSVERFSGSVPNMSALTGISHGRAVIILAMQHWSPGSLIVECAPTAVKVSLTGNHKAKKKEVQEAVKQVYGLESIPKPSHAADALAMIYHAAVKASLT